MHAGNNKCKQRQVIHGKSTREQSYHLELHEGVINDQKSLEVKQQMLRPHDAFAVVLSVHGPN